MWSIAQTTFNRGPNQIISPATTGHGSCLSRRSAYRIVLWSNSYKKGHSSVTGPIFRLKNFLCRTPNALQLVIIEQYRRIVKQNCVSSAVEKTNILVAEVIAVLICKLKADLPSKTTISDLDRLIELILLIGLECKRFECKSHNILQYKRNISARNCIQIQRFQKSCGQLHYWNWHRQPVIGDLTRTLVLPPLVTRNCLL